MCVLRCFTRLLPANSLSIVTGWYKPFTNSMQVCFSLCSWASRQELDMSQSITAVEHPKTDKLVFCVYVYHHGNYHIQHGCHVKLNTALYLYTLHMPCKVYLVQHA